MRGVKGIMATPREHHHDVTVPLNQSHGYKPDHVYYNELPQYHDQSQYNGSSLTESQNNSPRPSAHDRTFHDIDDVLENNAQRPRRVDPLKVDDENYYDDTLSSLDELHKMNSSLQSSGNGTHSSGKSKLSVHFEDEVLAQDAIHSRVDLISSPKGKPRGTDDDEDGRLNPVY